MNITLLLKKQSALDINYYKNKNYNNERRVRLMLIDASICKGDVHYEALIGMRHRLEIGVYNYACDMCLQNGHIPSWSDYRFCMLYNFGGFKIQKLLNKRPDVVERIISGDIQPDKILYLPTHVLLKEKKDVWAVENLRKQQIVIAKVSTDYACPRCSERSATLHEVQTRGCDEELTTKLTCQICNHKWSEGGE